VAGRTDAPLFVDACASTGRLPLVDGWAAAAASAHKWGGPAGVGVLLVRKGARWRNPFPGDERVDDRSTGFENVPAALAAAAALRAALDERQHLAEEHARLIEHLAQVVRAIPDTEVFLDDGPRLPHVIAFSCLYVDGEALVTELDRLGFSVASGSACTASSLEPSHVLAAMGALTHGNVRVSLGRDTDSAVVHRLAGELPGVVQRLRAEAGAPR
jgi:cysteine desulfurase